MKIIDSVAAVFCHDDQFFVIRRQSHLEDFPGYDSFPGGKIDREDSSHRHSAQFLCDLDGQKMHALAREIDEELAYDLPAGIASGQVTSVKYLATTLAPITIPVRFHLHFFRVDLKTRPQFTLDAGEIAEGRWKTPLQLLDIFERGDALMVPPLRRVLEELARNPLGDNFGDLSPQIDEDNYVPRVELLSGLQMLPIPSNTFPPLKRTNAFLLGDEGSRKILVDPSPESPQVLEKLIRTVRSDDVSALFLTHHHLDHHEYAPELAKHLNVPIWMSEDTLFRITQKQGPNYFSGVQIVIKGEGDYLTLWKGEVVLCHSVPGHDAGHLALAPESLRWFIVGDLIQSNGTVVISAPEGDMATYFQTMEKVIALDPAVIVPSHGMPMRSTFKLNATLQHRREREKMILELHLRGKSLDQILDIVYQGVEQRLRRFAVMNIESHMTKLRQEDRI